MRDGWKRTWWVGVAVLLLISGWTQGAWACRLLEPHADRVDTLWIHLDGFCFSADQREWAVTGADVLEALKAGKNLDLQGALVVDDVMLDQLPLRSVEDLPHLPRSIQGRLSQKGLKQVRVIPGAITIRDSQFEKVLATNLVDDVLVILGAVTISGTTFLQSVDFSKVMFVEPVVFSNVEVGYEGFFIGADFAQAVDFSHTVFGTHSRFHKAVFRAPVTFAEVQFKGVAEFLEVEFHQGANFSHTHFLSGTGFSGSVFDGPADFSGVKTAQEIYFRFSEFKEGVSFRQGHFPSVVDFSNSRFLGEHDFSGAEFSVSPDFTDSNISIDVPISRRRLNQQQWLLFGGLVILVGLYLWISKRRTTGDSA
ncbi:MAG: pentapeptide repeat-containing protein [Nitrospirota bacterium]|nr:pentapeptide repeat-containing protein [Nitrospirota bacterium]